MVVALYCAVMLLGFGDDTAPPTIVNPPVPKVEKPAPSAEKAKLPYPFPAVTVVPVQVDIDDENAVLVRIDMPKFWRTLSVEEQKTVKKLPQLVEMVQERLQPPGKKHEPKTIMPSVSA